MDQNRHNLNDQPDVAVRPIYCHMGVCTVCSAKLFRIVVDGKCPNSEQYLQPERSLELIRCPICETRKKTADAPHAHITGFVSWICAISFDATDPGLWPLLFESEEAARDFDIPITNNLLVQPEASRTVMSLYLDARNHFLKNQK